MIYPPFTADQVEQIRLSYFILIPNSEEFAVKFYRRLFAARPEVRDLFGADMDAQHTKLMDTLTALVESLEREHIVDESLTALSQRHVRYGARAEHYDWVQEALLETLKEYVPNWETDDLASLWKTLIERVSSSMKPQS